MFIFLHTYIEVLEVDILWPRWVARIGVTRSTQACFLAADRRDYAIFVCQAQQLQPAAPRDVRRRLLARRRSQAAPPRAQSLARGSLIDRVESLQQREQRRPASHDDMTSLTPARTSLTPDCELQTLFRTIHRRGTTFQLVSSGKSCDHRRDAPFRRSVSVLSRLSRRTSFGRIG